MQDQLRELRSKMLLKKEEYKQAVERHEFLEQHSLIEEINQLRSEWKQLQKGLN
ncbi:hypothetical protein GXN76_12175 [Kroppenstedtia pulmonis]|uniref:Uncharacterized protein n=1 Tax=Kroppenstedtia pulmonis TaxID=1380685 RepID=A0A7D4BKZ2_9BACL|nr:hypothetical protein [Kroppenstedtia pulmonis]QKG85150.1 hypothetical protein GXN76_12175 [Kroppenstedtia pulmonis]